MLFVCLSVFNTPRSHTPQPLDLKLYGLLFRIIITNEFLLYKKNTAQI